MTRIVFSVCLALPMLACASTATTDAERPASPTSDPSAVEPEDRGGPRYKPSSSSPAPVDISTNDYGAFSGAPEAPQIGDVAVDFSLPLVDGGTFDLGEARKAGPVLVMFYRGFW